jgi:hypothetical protein
MAVRKHHPAQVGAAKAEFRECSGQINTGTGDASIHQSQLGAIPPQVGLPKAGLIRRNSGRSDTISMSLRLSRRPEPETAISR